MDNGFEKLPPSLRSYIGAASLLSFWNGSIAALNALTKELETKKIDYDENVHRIIMGLHGHMLRKQQSCLYEFHESLNDLQKDCLEVINKYRVKKGEEPIKSGYEKMNSLWEFKFDEGGDDGEATEPIPKK